MQVTFDYIFPDIIRYLKTRNYFVKFRVILLTYKDCLLNVLI